MTGNEPISWDQYAAEHAITEQEAPQAFAASLYEVSDGRWGGHADQIDNDPSAGESPMLS